MNANRIILSIILFSVLSVPCFVFYHEFTHIYFNNFRFSKICFLDCPNSNEVGYTNFGKERVGNEKPIAGVWLDNPKPKATDESLANGIGLISVAGLFFAYIFLIIMPKQINKLNKDTFK